MSNSKSEVKVVVQLKSEVEVVYDKFLLSSHFLETYYKNLWVDAKPKFIPLLLLILTVEKTCHDYPSGVFRVLTRGL